MITQIDGTRQRECPRKTWWDGVNEDKQILGLSCEDAEVRNRQRMKIRASSIPWHTYFHAMPRNSPFAAEFAACRKKNADFPVFATFMFSSFFSGSFLILLFIKK